MGLFGSKEDKAKAKEEKMLRKDLAREKKERFEGTNMQPIGQIPSGVDVLLSLSPENETLIISYKAIKITLPYFRIVSFTNSVVVTDKTNNILKGAQNYLEQAETKDTGLDLLGTKKLVAGLAGNVASSLIPHNLNVETVSTLTFIDKNGEQQELKFSNSAETGYALSNEEAIERFQDQRAVSFSEMIRIIASRYAENITEL